MEYNEMSESEYIKTKFEMLYAELFPYLIRCQQLVNTKESIEETNYRTWLHTVYRLAFRFECIELFSKTQINEDAKVSDREMKLRVAKSKFMKSLMIELCPVFYHSLIIKPLSLLNIILIINKGCEDDERFLFDTLAEYTKHFVPCDRPFVTENFLNLFVTAFRDFKIRFLDYYQLSYRYNYEFEDEVHNFLNPVHMKIRYDKEGVEDFCKHPKRIDEIYELFDEFKLFYFAKPFDDLEEEYADTFYLPKERDDLLYLLKIISNASAYANLFRIPFLKPGLSDKNQLDDVGRRKLEEHLDLMEKEAEIERRELKRQKALRRKKREEKLRRENEAKSNLKNITNQAEYVYLKKEDAEVGCEMLKEYLDHVGREEEKQKKRLQQKSIELEKEMKRKKQIKGSKCKSETDLNSENVKDDSNAQSKIRFSIKPFSKPSCFTFLEYEALKKRRLAEKGKDETETRL